MQVVIEELYTAGNTADFVPGDMGVLADGHECDGHVVLMAYDRLVSLTDPECTWELEYTFDVLVIPKGRRLTVFA